MRLRLASLLVLMNCLAVGAIIDRIAVVVGNSIVKDSDIERDIRVTDFLNHQALDLSARARKESASRLIDQVFIRREIRIGDYPQATLQEADGQLNALKKQRFKTESAFQSALRSYGLTELELRTQFQWQLTVLKFIDLRFKPAVLVTDEEIDKYYRDHVAALRHEYPGKSLDELHDEIRNIITGEKVNQQFFTWLDDQRKNAKISFHEETLA